jgi:hypothetical protein
MSFLEYCANIEDSRTDVSKHYDLLDPVSYHVSMRQWVFSLPFQLRFCLPAILISWEKC